MRTLVICHFTRVHTTLSRVKVALWGILADVSELVSFLCAKQIKPEALGFSI